MHARHVQFVGRAAVLRSRVQVLRAHERQKMEQRQFEEARRRASAAEYFASELKELCSCAIDDLRRDADDAPPDDETLCLRRLMLGDCYHFLADVEAGGDVRRQLVSRSMREYNDVLDLAAARLGDAHHITMQAMLQKCLLADSVSGAKQSAYSDLSRYALDLQDYAMDIAARKVMRYIETLLETWSHQLLANAETDVLSQAASVASRSAPHELKFVVFLMSLVELHEDLMRGRRIAKKQITDFGALFKENAEATRQLLQSSREGLVLETLSNDTETEDAATAQFVQLCTDASRIVEKMIADCGTDLSMLVYCQTLRGDCFKYIAESSNGKQRQTAMQRALDVYLETLKSAAELPPTHQARTRAVVRFAAFFEETMCAPAKSIEVLEANIALVKRASTGAAPAPAAAAGAAAGDAEAAAAASTALQNLQAALTRAQARLKVQDQELRSLAEKADAMMHSKSVGPSEVNALATAVKMAIDDRRRRQKRLHTHIQQQGAAGSSGAGASKANSGSSAVLKLREEKEKIGEEIALLCRKMVELLDCRLIPTLRDEHAAFVGCHTLKGDYYRYIAQFGSRNVNARDAEMRALAAYEVGLRHAEKYLAADSQVRLGHVLNLAFFQAEVLDQRAEAIEIAKSALVAAERMRGHADTAAIAEKLKLNITLWEAKEKRLVEKNRVMVNETMKIDESELMLFETYSASGVDHDLDERRKVTTLPPSPSRMRGGIALPAQPSSDVDNFVRFTGDVRSIMTVQAYQRALLKFRDTQLRNYEANLTALRLPSSSPMPSARRVYSPRSHGSAGGRRSATLSVASDTLSDDLRKF